jgi:molybdopterin-guanine dinucleotide biosynthesis protein A
MENVVTGIVLAGGKSTRMGYDKGLAEINGKPLVSYAVKTLKAAGCSVVISSNNPEYEQFGYPVIPDRILGIGPLGGIYSALMISESWINVVFSCDMPLIPAEMIRFLLKRAYHSQSVIPIFKGYPEPLCGCYSKNITGIIEKLIKRKSYKMQNLLKNLETNYVEINRTFPFFGERMFANINDPVQLKEIEAELDGK